MDFAKRLDELNVGHAIKGEVLTKLKDILPVLTKARLSFLAANYQLPGRSKMKKLELADALYQHLTDVNVLRNAILLAESEEWEIVHRLLKAPYVQDNTIFPGMYLFLMDKGLVYSFYKEANLFILIPEEIKEAYGKLPLKAFREERDRLQLILQYINASANLYGICPLAKVIEIFNIQNERPLTEAELYGAYTKITSRARTWYFERGNVINDYFGYEAEDEMELLLEQVKDKPYYIPDKQELLKYADSGYFEKTPQLNRLQEYVSQHLCKDETLVDDLVDDIQLACSMEDSLDAIIYEFQRRSISFTKREQLQAILPLIMDVYNHTRIWSNRGHTPAELGSGFSQSKNKNNVIYLGQQAVSSKVGRNDPCPCGSGKKYKKCCG
ncbi:YecA family protein [Paenibacillus xerothermodurans]|uniref:SEC-C motif-containing protein n=1 Tax=Paenibacillus xerothermodurans TaxID=1977292 RepID=A0A2W1NND2_PAEXE|nr:SEC-C metal-binding domain-containing protein [Paenibacillus xerothermodurans]PZE19326.1 hypothetical protein CBW46_019140 [Paenibacillus xerothermodurans]